ncbi:hypothetical protein C823_003997 [Eubacterium plexicaudatum ASF492]|uniref:BIG2 domain-containing protein n=1 Tax=Eubacterium plexicaudatum ASF492 TaxID=1235802 RepID=N2AB68_9FIRM|nr:hypothetical protein C823_003997 [Eubacterium plexicaudatum ASF492]
MRIRQLKLEAAVLLAFILSFGTAVAPCVPVPGTSAAAQKQVKLNVKSKTLKVGQKGYKLKLVNNQQGWKIKKVTTTNAAVCKPYGKKKTYVLLKGNGKGSAAIQVKVTRTVVKNGKKTTKSKQLSCKVRVKADAAKDTEQTLKEDVTVSGQQQLEAALKNPATKTLRFQTEDEGAFTIPKADYPEIDLIVDAPNADMENNGTFKSISVQAIKDSTWLENAAGNFLNILAKTARIVVSQGAGVSGIAFAQTGAKVALEVNGTVNEVSFRSPDTDAKVSVSQGGSLGNVSVEEAAQRTKLDMDVSGSVGDVKLAAPQSDMNMAVADGGMVSNVSLDTAAENAKADMDVKGTVSDVSLDAPKADVKMAVDENGKVNDVTVSKEMNIALSGSTKTAIPLKISASATITTSANVALDSSAGLNLVLEKGSEGSSIKISGNTAAVSLKVQNRTEINITIHTSTGNITIVKNSSRDITVSAPSASGSSASAGSSYGSSSSASSPSAGSSSGGSSSAGSSSGGSSSSDSESEDNKTDAEPKGIAVDRTYFTMKKGEEQEIYFSADPKEAGRLCDFNTVTFGRNTNVTYIYEKEDDPAPIGIKITARYAGTEVIHMRADIMGNEEDSPIILRNQGKVIRIQVTEDGAAPVSEIKLTTDSASIEKGDSVHASLQLNAPEGAKLTRVEFLDTHNLGGVMSVDLDGRTLEETTASCNITGTAAGNDELAALATVELADGTEEKIASNVVPLEVTDSTPDPSAEETTVELNTVPGLPVDEWAFISAELDVHAYSARIMKTKWTSSDPNIIHVYSDEVNRDYISITGVALGKATITAEITIVTSSQIFTKKASSEVEVKPDFELTLVSSVDVVTGSAIQADGWEEQDRGKPAFKFITDLDHVSFTPCYGLREGLVFDSCTINTQEQIDGLRVVELANGTGYGFVIQDADIMNRTFRIPIRVKTYVSMNEFKYYTADLTVYMAEWTNGTFLAQCKAEDIQRADP